MEDTGDLRSQRAGCLGEAALFNGMDLWARETVPWAHERARLVCGMVLRDHPALVLHRGVD
jgi:hypothetical protein